MKNATKHADDLKVLFKRQSKDYKPLPPVPAEPPGDPPPPATPAAPPDPAVAPADPPAGDPVPAAPWPADPPRFGASEGGASLQAAHADATTKASAEREARNAKFMKWFLGSDAMWCEPWRNAGRALMSDITRSITFADNLRHERNFLVPVPRLRDAPRSLENRGSRVNVVTAEVPRGGPRPPSSACLAPLRAWHTARTA